MTEDDTLYTQFLSGDASAYDALMLRHGDGLTRYLFGLLRQWPDAELSLEDLDKVAGGEISIDLLDKGEIGYWYVAKCPYCSFNIEFPATGSLEDSEEIVRRHIQLYHPTGEAWDDPIYSEAP